MNKKREKPDREGVTMTRQELTALMAAIICAGGHETYQWHPEWAVGVAVELVNRVMGDQLPGTIKSQPERDEAL